MPGCPLKTRNAAHHFTAAFVLFAVLALPFHFHIFTPTAQLAQECSCYQGARTYAVALTAPADWTPLFEATLVRSFEPRVVSCFTRPIRSIRAPPAV